MIEQRAAPVASVVAAHVAVAPSEKTRARPAGTGEPSSSVRTPDAAKGVPASVTAPLVSRSTVELSLGNDEAALAYLDRTAVLIERLGLVEPEYFPWQGDHLEALIRGGRREEAAERAAHLAKLGNDGERRWATGIASRVNAQLTSDRDEAHSSFEHSLASFESLGMPFEVARTLLARGAPRDLADARRLFLRLGASVWAEASSQSWDGKERRTTLAAEEHSQRLLAQLSPAERNVALSVAAGHTNREIAAELHLSVKTVDHYLQQAYRWLGLRNRTELATAIARSIAPPTR